MHRSLRLVNLERSYFAAPRPSYVCFNCRHEPFARQLRHNSNSVTERIRRKLWGTDKPPGLDDPYGGKGVLERRWSGEGQPNADTERTPNAYLDKSSTIAPPDDYVGATTWDNLKKIGHLGKWSDYSPKHVDAYRRFMAKDRVWGTDVDNAARVAAAEICILHKLNKPLISACHVTEHDKAVRRLLLKCRVDPSSAADWGSAIVFPGQRAKEALIYVFDQIGGQGKKRAEEDVSEFQSQEAPESKELQAELFPINSFKSLLLNDKGVRFAFMKRLSQLTGHYLPDPLIHSSATVGAAVRYIHDVITPKPKLSIKLSSDPVLQELPNVKIFNRRYRPSDVDYVLGRKKVIDAALRERGLLK